MTVRNNKNKIIQFTYGDDHINPTKTENQSFPLHLMSLEEIYTHFHIPIDKSNSLFNTIYTKEASKRVKKQQKKLNKTLVTMLERFINKRDDIVKHVFKGEENIVLHIPVHFHRIMNNVKTTLYS